MSKDAISISLSCINNDGNLEAGIHISDSDGAEINSEVSGSSYEELFDNIVTDVMAQYESYLNETQEKECNCEECELQEYCENADKDAYIANLEDKIDALQNRLDVLEQKQTQPMWGSKSYNSSLKDLKQLEKMLSKWSKIF